MQNGPRKLAPPNPASRTEMQLRSSLSRPRPLRLHPSSHRKAISPLVFPFHLKASNPVFPAAPRTVLPAPTAAQGGTPQLGAETPPGITAEKKALHNSQIVGNPTAPTPPPASRAPPQAN